MREIHIRDSGCAEAVVAALHENVVMIQLPTVFALLAAPNADGVRWLNAAKSRLPNKTYSTCIGDMERFYAMVMPGTLPPELDSAAALGTLTGAILRVAVADPSFNSATVRAGTHQALLLDGPHGALFNAIETGLKDAVAPDLFAGRTVAAPLGSSANISGHPDGSITTWERAYAFGTDRGVPLVVRSEFADDRQASPTILALLRDRVTVERAGPRPEQLLSRLPARLRP